MQLVQRPYVYSFKSPSIAIGQTLIEQQVQIEADNAFALRGIGAFNPGLANNTFSMRFADASRRFRSNDLVNMNQDIGGVFEGIGIGTLSDGGNYAPVIPQIIYPPNSNLELNLRNDDPAGAHSITMLFFGVGLYRKGSVWAPGWPARRFTIQPFSYTVPTQITRGSTASIVSDVLIPRPQDVNSDSDFVLTHGQCEADASQGIGSFTDLRMRVKDNQGKYFSNDFIPITRLLGQNLAERPGMFYPGLYLQRNEWLWFDLQLNDTGSTATLFLEVTFEGYKVYPLL